MSQQPQQQEEHRTRALSIYARYAHLMAKLTGREADALVQTLASLDHEGLDLTTDFVKARVQHILSRRAA